jgi:hypothetical protein
MFEAFVTRKYKGCYISEKYDRLFHRSICEWSTADNEVFRRPVKSWRAAQIKITNYLKRKKIAQGGM